MACPQRAAAEIEPDRKGQTLRFTPLLCETFILRAEKRMMKLCQKLKETPFLQQHGINAAEYLQPLKVASAPELPMGQQPAGMPPCSSRLLTEDRGFDSLRDLHT
jgi:hypothetical protein